MISYDFQFKNLEILHFWQFW